MKKLPVLSSFEEVYEGVFTHFFELVRIAWLPLSIAIGLRLWMQFGIMPDTRSGALSPAQAQEAMRQALPAIAALVLPLWVAGAMMAVGFHRFVLLGEHRRGFAGTGIAFGKPELLYLWSGIKISLVAFVPILVVSFGAGVTIGVVLGWAKHNPAATPASLVEGVVALAILAGALAIVLLMGCLMRLSLVLPHVALGHRSELRLIWRLTKGNTWRLLGYFCLVILPFSFAMGLVFLVLSLGFPSVARLTTIILMVPVFAAATMLGITMLSVAYREIVGLPAAAAPETGTHPA